MKIIIEVDPTAEPDVRVTSSGTDEVGRRVASAPTGPATAGAIDAGPAPLERHGGAAGVTSPGGPTGDVSAGSAPQRPRSRGAR